MLAESVTASSGLGERQVHVDVASVVVRLALTYVAESAGCVAWAPGDAPACTRVSDRLPRGDERVDVLVVRDEPASCQAATNAVLRGAARTVVLWNEPESLVHALQALDAGSVLIPQRAIDLGMSAPRLSERQVETLQLLAVGRSSRAIATALRQSESTAKRDVAELLQRFDASNRTALVSAAAALGFIRRLPREP